MKTSIRVVKRFSCAVLKVQAGNTPAQHNISGDNSLRVPPVPIPNTEVKPQHADGTWLATARESRSSPDSILFGQSAGLFFFYLAETFAGVSLFCFMQKSRQQLKIIQYIT